MLVGGSLKLLSQNQVSHPSISICHNGSSQHVVTRRTQISQIRRDHVKIIRRTFAESQGTIGGGAIYTDLNEAKRDIENQQFAEAESRLKSSIFHFGNTDKLTEEMEAMTLLSQIYQSQQRMEDLTDFLKKAVDRLRKVNDPATQSTQIQFLSTLSTTLAQQGSQDAIPAIKDLINLAHDLKRHDTSSSASNLLGMLYSREKLPEVALKNFNDALKDSIKAQNLELQIAAQMNIAREHANMGNFLESNRGYQSLLKSQRNLPKFGSEWNLYSEMGDNYNRMSKMDDAVECHRKALSLAERGGTDRQVMTSLQKLVEAHDHMGESAESKKYAMKLQQFAETNQNSEAQTQSDLNLGRLEIQNANYAKAEKHYRTSYRTALQKGDSWAQASVLANLAQLYEIWKQPDNGQVACQEGYRVALASKNMAALRGILLTWGNIHLSMKRYEDAIKAYHEGLILHEEANDDEAILTSYAQMMKAYKGIGKEKEASFYMMSAMALSAKMEKS
eukprot:TRINITY_DN21689_c0_g1_i1.p1 TRINITY_DN21689_c0_g1~~TRINITY_DN21689_c0_g1_i1.p1  ORF type:complete len:504 (-),score=149.68 TRINITY_DN21689_c0_g1_i1:12-1523(-)